MKLYPKDYARSRKSWIGTVPSDQLKRLANEVACTGAVEVSLNFFYDEDKRVRVQGEARVETEVPCHLCLHSVKQVVLAEIDARVVQSDDEARQLAQEHDVIQIGEPPIDISELIEDDLLLSVPWQVCEDGDDCERRPKGIETSANSGGNKTGTTRPFANLADLIKR